MLLLLHNEELLTEMEILLHFPASKCTETVPPRKMSVFMSGLWLLKVLLPIMKDLKSITKWNSLEVGDIGRDIKITWVIRARVQSRECETATVLNPAVFQQVWWKLCPRLAILSIGVQWFWGENPWLTTIKFAYLGQYI